MSVKPEDVVRGQYDAGDDGPSYKEDAENPESTTESYIALKTHVDNWRWAGTPIYLRTGKRLKAKASEIAVVFKPARHHIL